MIETTRKGGDYKHTDQKNRLSRDAKGLFRKKKTDTESSEVKYGQECSKGTIKEGCILVPGYWIRSEERGHNSC